MTFSRNYLSAQSQPWAREVQKRVANLETAFRSAEVNNTTRDDQLAASFRRLDATFLETQQAAADAQQAASDALDAINGLTGLGTPGGDYEVDGANLVVGSVTATQIDADYVYAGEISANQITAGTIDASEITVTNLNASNITTGSLTADRISGGTIDASDISGVNISGVSISASDFTSGGIVDVAQIDCGIIQVDQDLQALRNSFVANNTTTSFNGNLFINSSGTMFRNPTISSIEAKENITEFTFDTDAFMSVNPVTFNYKREAVRTDEEAQTTSLGFILENFEDIGLGEHLVIPANEVDKYKGLRYDKLYMFLHKSVQELNERVKELENGATN